MMGSEAIADEIGHLRKKKLEEQHTLEAATLSDKSLEKNSLTQGPQQTS